MPSADQVVLHDCPECGLPAETGGQITADGAPTASVLVTLRCVQGHVFNGRPSDVFEGMYE